MSNSAEKVEHSMSDYRTFRGRCKEYVDRAVSEDRTLTAVRGHYYCPIWGVKEQHWWCVRPDGSIYDPTAKQFPSQGHGIYEPFDGTVECAECGKIMAETEAAFDGRYAFCSYKCNGRFVGVL